MVTLSLFLSDVGGSEILLILVVILMFFGSKSIPGIARTMGRTIRQIKDASQEVQNEIRKSGGDIKGDLNLTGIISDTRDNIEQPFREHAQALDQVMNDDPRFQKPVSFVQPTHTPSTGPLDQPQEDEPVSEVVETKNPDSNQIEN